MSYFICHIRSFLDHDLRPLVEYSVLFTFLRNRMRLTIYRNVYKAMLEIEPQIYTMRNVLAGLKKGR